MVKKTKDGYAVYGKKGNKKLSRTYQTKEAAIARLKEIEYFKQKGKTKK